MHMPRYHAVSQANKYNCLLASFGIPAQRFIGGHGKTFRKEFTNPYTHIG